MIISFVYMVKVLSKWVIVFIYILDVFYFKLLYKKFLYFIKVMIFSIGVGFFYILFWWGVIGCVRIDIGFIYLYIYGKIGVDMLFFVISNNNLFYRMGWEIKLINLIFVWVFVCVISFIWYFFVYNLSLLNFWFDFIYVVV